MRLIAFLILAALPGRAEIFSFGVKGGLPLTEAFQFERPYNAKTKLYVVGPTIELHLPLGASVEFDALYRRLSYDRSAAAVTANSWEFPLLFKYRVSPGLARPYIAVGPSFQRISGATEFIGGVVTGSPGELRNQSTVALNFAGGLELRGPFLRISPEIRYSYRNSENFREPSGRFRSNQHQVDFLVGITF